MQYSFAAFALAGLATANPIIQARQAVTAAISPDAPAPAGCSASAAASFGIVAVRISPSAKTKREEMATQTSDGQIQAMTVAPVSMITDGQLQGAMHTQIMMPIANQISDGQIQVQTTLAPVTEFSDGQPQAPTVTASSTVSSSSDGQVLAPASTTTSSAAAASSTASNSKMVTCQGGLSIGLDNGVLTDEKGRTGYIASNFQFQFDKPPQAGAIYTAGWSECGNGTLALGGSAIFYQCLSGSFYNLYDRSWAAQCSPIYINTLTQVAC